MILILIFLIYCIYINFKLIVELQKLEYSLLVDHLKLIPIILESLDSSKLFKPLNFI